MEDGDAIYVFGSDTELPDAPVRNSETGRVFDWSNNPYNGRNRVNNVMTNANENIAEKPNVAFFSKASTFVAEQVLSDWSSKYQRTPKKMALSRKVLIAIFEQDGKDFPHEQKSAAQRWLVKTLDCMWYRLPPPVIDDFSTFTVCPE